MAEKKVGKYKNFRGLAHLRVDVGLEDIGQGVTKSREIPKDGLLTAIFAPDPVTSMPRSDLHIALSGSLDPTTQEYIRRALQRPIPETGVGHPDPDVVLDNARKHNESIDAYVQRLAKSVENYYKPAEK